MKIYQIVYCSMWELLNSFCKAYAIKDYLVLEVFEIWIGWSGTNKENHKSVFSFPLDKPLREGG